MTSKSCLIWLIVVLQNIVLRVQCPTLWCNVNIPIMSTTSTSCYIANVNLCAAWSGRKNLVENRANYLLRPKLLTNLSGKVLISLCFTFVLKPLENMTKRINGTARKLNWISPLIISSLQPVDEHTQRYVTDVLFLISEVIATHICTQTQL